jgi:hypothetical protein
LQAAAEAAQDEIHNVNNQSPWARAERELHEVLSACSNLHSLQFQVIICRNDTALLLNGVQLPSQASSSFLCSVLSILQIESPSFISFPPHLTLPYYPEFEHCKLHSKQNCKHFKLHFLSVLDLTFSLVYRFLLVHVLTP